LYDEPLPYGQDVMHTLDRANSAPVFSAPASILDVARVQASATKSDNGSAILL
jgi:hypothetical protein